MSRDRVQVGRATGLCSNWCSPTGCVCWRSAPADSRAKRASSSFACFSPSRHTHRQYTDFAKLRWQQKFEFRRNRTRHPALVILPWPKWQQPRCLRAPRAGCERTWRRLLRAWLGPKPGSLNISGFGYLPAERGDLRRHGRICRDLHGAAPAGHGGGCGGTRSRLRSRSLRKTRPLTCPPTYP